MNPSSAWTRRNRSFVQKLPERFEVAEGLGTIAACCSTSTKVPAWPYHHAPAG
jgi:hypothetical protein